VQRFWVGGPLRIGALLETDGALMSGLRRNWPLAMTAALASTLMAGAADARGGGHGGGIAHPMMSPSHMGTIPSRGIGLSGIHPALPGAMPHQPGGATRAPFAATRMPLALGGSPPTMQNPVGARAGNGSASSAAVLQNSGVGTIPTPPPQGVTPPSAIADPTPELAPIAPLSPQLPTQFSTGGVVQPNMALSPGGSSSASPSESAPSAPGGGGKSLADCMGFWARETHMSKAEWKAACARTMQDYPTVLR
jgi:hypothetical protein